MKIIMLGAPGAGKGTQAKMIAAKYGIPHISTGDIFRANIKNGTELGAKAKQYMDKGELVPDELVVDLVIDRFKEDDCKNGYVLDGFPRTIPQAEALDKALTAIGENVDYAINVEVPDDNIINRMGGRRACVGCGATYHVVYSPTKVAGKCDTCGGDRVRACRGSCRERADIAHLTDRACLQQRKQIAVDLSGGYRLLYAFYHVFILPKTLIVVSPVRT